MYVVLMCIFYDNNVLYKHAQLLILCFSFELIIQFRRCQLSSDGPKVTGVCCVIKFSLRHMEECAAPSADSHI